MNNKTMLYAILAVFLGYSIMTYIPSAFSPQILLSQSDLELNDDILTSTSPGDNFSTGGRLNENVDNNSKNLAGIETNNHIQYLYILIDLVIALFVYYLARKQLV